MKKFLMVPALLLLIVNISEAVLVNRVVAVVNGEVITESDLVRFAKKIAIARNIDLAQMDRAAEDKVVRESLNELIEDMLILSYAKRLGLGINEKAVEKRIAVIKDGFNTEMEFLSRLEGDGLSYESLWQRIYNDILKTKTVDYFVKSKIESHPQEIEEYYFANEDEFIAPEAFKVEKIYVKKIENSKNRIDQIRLLIEKKVPFEILVQNHSDSLADNVREGEWLFKGRVSEDIANAVFGLNVGEVSDIVETESAYYIFKVAAKAEAHLEKLDKVKNRVYNSLYQKKFSEKYNEFITELKEDAQIDIKI
ncbi:MAG: peptidyl-prolyl cis-trans isomerase [Candidatus Kaelpia aquatica]|nr:peptidyl-prolyl cis-trans isomerase [Candidatus Kaelpia aquatica]